MSQIVSRVFWFFIIFYHSITPSKFVCGLLVSIVPENFVSLDSSHWSEGAQNALFAWHWTECNSGVYRVVTLDDVRGVHTVSPLCKLYNANFVIPKDLVGIRDYANELDNAVFNWRWFERNTGEWVRVITLEDANNNSEPQCSGKWVEPTDLVGTMGYDGDISNMMFNWRWKTIGETQFRVLTLDTRSYIDIE